MELVTQAAGICVIAALLGLVLRQGSPEITLLLALAAAAAVLLALGKPLGELLAFLNRLAEQTSVPSALFLPLYKNRRYCDGCKGRRRTVPGCRRKRAGIGAGTGGNRLRPAGSAAPAAGGAGTDRRAAVRNFRKILLFLGLACLLLTVPVLAAELPPDVEDALPREAGKLLDGVGQWDAASLTDGLRSIWVHLLEDASGILQRQTRGAASILLVVLLCSLVGGFQKTAGASPRFLTMAGTLAIAALTAGSLDSLMGSGAAAMEQMNTFSKALLPMLAAVSALSGGAWPERRCGRLPLCSLQICCWSDPRAADAHGVSLCRNAGCRRKPVRQAAAVRGGDDPFHLRLATDNGAAALYAISHCQRYFLPVRWTAHGYGWQKPPFPAWCRWWEALSPRRRKPCWPVRAC